jgi:hypothetical protein
MNSNAEEIAPLGRWPGEARRDESPRGTAGRLRIGAHGPIKKNAMSGYAVPSSVQDGPADPITAAGSLSRRAAGPSLDGSHARYVFHEDSPRPPAPCRLEKCVVQQVARVVLEAPLPEAVQLGPADP